MLTDTEFQAWCARIELPSAGRAIVSRLRSSLPRRAVRSGPRHIAGSYPSAKMGVGQQFESRTCEFKATVAAEFDADVLEYHNQPSEAVRMVYRNRSGRMVTVDSTADQFLLRRNCGEWVEWKTEQGLERLVAETPERYRRAPDGSWQCPPGEAYAASLGLKYRLRSTREIPPVLGRNLSFMEDYYVQDQWGTDIQAADELVAVVTQQPGIGLAVLLDRALDFGARSEDVYLLIARGRLYIDIEREPIGDPERVHIFHNKAIADAFGMLLAPRSSLSVSSTGVEIRIGARFSWDCRPYRITNVGEKHIWFAALDIVEKAGVAETPRLLRSEFESLAKSGDITGLPDPAEEDAKAQARMSVLLRTGEAGLRKAMDKCKAVQAHRQKEPLPFPVSDRTLRHWNALCRRGLVMYDDEFLALVEKANTGNRTPRLSPAASKLMDGIIEMQHETVEQRGKFAIWSLLTKACQDEGVLVPSYRTFCRAVNTRPRYEQKLARMGRRAAYDEEPFYPFLDDDTPRHGDYPFHICHLDHTPIPVKTRLARTKGIAPSLWFSTLTDAYSRRFLVPYLSYDPPSYRTDLMVLRLCVKRFGRLPQILVVDNGADFHSVYFEAFTTQNRVTIFWRPVAKPRFGAIEERSFLTAETQVFHNLLGNTRIYEKIRQVVPEVDPRRNAVWELAPLYEHLRNWTDEIYDQAHHATLGMSPREAFLTAIERTGQRQARNVTYDPAFSFSTLPATKRRVAKIESNRGVKINYIYYWNDIFRTSPEVIGTRVYVRYDPMDAGIAFAFVKGSWTLCRSEYWHVLRGRTERQLMIASDELRSMNTQHGRSRSITAARLAQHLLAGQATERLLTQQLADHEARTLYGDVFAPPLPGLESRAQFILTVASSDNRLSAPASEATLALPAAPARAASERITDEQPDIAAAELGIQLYGELPV